jgi:AcrR family transcriptional regulator
MGSTGRVGRPPAGNSDETRRLIVRAARERFARDGYRATTNKLIASDVGLTSTAIYHYVESKAALYAAVYCDTIDRVYTGFQQAADAEVHLLARFSAVLRRANEMQVDDPSIAGFIVAVAHETQRPPSATGPAARAASAFLRVVGRTGRCHRRAAARRRSGSTRRPARSGVDRLGADDGRVG